MSWGTTSAWTRTICSSAAWNRLDSIAILKGLGIAAQVGGPFEVIVVIDACHRRLALLVDLGYSAARQEHLSIGLSLKALVQKREPRAGWFYGLWLV